jgi:hypothetical protein
VDGTSRCCLALLLEGFFVSDLLTVAAGGTHARGGHGRLASSFVGDHPFYGLGRLSAFCSPYRICRLSGAPVQLPGWVVPLSSDKFCGGCLPDLFTATWVRILCNRCNL